MGLTKIRIYPEEILEGNWTTELSKQQVSDYNDKSQALNRVPT